jgi:hypothetical protein
MDLPPLRAAALAATVILAIPCGVARAESGDAAVAAAEQAAAGQTSLAGEESVGAASGAEGDSSAGAGATEQPAPPAEVPPTAAPEPPPPPAEPPPASPPPPPPPADQGASEATPGEPSGESSGPAAGSSAGEEAPASFLGESRGSALNDGGQPVVASTPAAPADGADSAPAPPVSVPERPEQTAVDRLLPRLKNAARPVDRRAAAVDRRPETRAPSSGARLIPIDPGTWIEGGPSSDAPRQMATAPVERGGGTPAAPGPPSGGDPGDPPPPPPSSPAPGSATASPGGSFFAGGLASLAALLIALALPQLRARFELLPRGRCTVAFLRPLERPG